MGDAVIPQKYLSCDTSGIIVDLKPGERNQLEFCLKDD